MSRLTDADCDHDALNSAVDVLRLQQAQPHRSLQHILWEAIKDYTERAKPPSAGWNSMTDTNPIEAGVPGVEVVAWRYSYETLNGHIVARITDNEEDARTIADDDGHVEPLVRKSDYDALAEQNAALVKERDEWHDRANRQQVRARAAEAERDTLSSRLQEAEKALGGCRCPRPCNHRPDEFTIRECVDAGECGCSDGAALTNKGESDAT